MTLKVPGQAEKRLRQRAEVTVLGEELPAEEYRKAVAGALLCQLRDRIGDERLEVAGTQLELVSNYALGLDNIDLAACTKHSDFVGHTSEVLAGATPIGAGCVSPLSTSPPASLHRRRFGLLA